MLSLAGPTLNHPLLLGVLALQVLASDAMDEVCTKGIVPYATQRQTGLHHYDYLRETDAAVLGVTVVGRDLVGTTKRILGASANLTGGGSTPPSRWRRLRGFRSGRFCVFDESVAAVAAAVENDEEALTSPDPTCRTQGYLPQAKQATAASKNSSNSQNKTKKHQGPQQNPSPPSPPGPIYLAQQSLESGGTWPGRRNAEPAHGAVPATPSPRRASATARPMPF